MRRLARFARLLIAQNPTYVRVFH